MAGRRALFPALLALTVLLPAFADEPDEAALHQRVMDAEAKATELTTRLETVYLAIQADFEFFRSSPWRRIAGPLVRSVGARMEALRSGQADVGKALGDDFVAAELLDEVCARRMAAAAVARAAKLERGESMSATDLLKHASTVVFPK